MNSLAPGQVAPPRAQAGGWRRWLPRLAIFLALLSALALVLLLDSWSALGSAPVGERLERMEASPNHREGTFLNRLETRDPELGPVLRAWLDGEQVREPVAALPAVSRRKRDFERAPASGLRVTWLGHSTVLVEIDGKRVLTDPVWAERASPFTFLGPSRFYAPPLALDELPQLDAVIISHDHYDHLDHRTIQALQETGVKFFVPLGVGAHLAYWGVAAAQIVELDWWQQAEIGSLRVVSTPARHFSGRSLADRNRTLWTSWALVGPEHRVFFSGDTAMFPGFKEIGDRLGPFDVTLMETGAYNELWADVHLGPEQAVAAHQALRGRLLLPIHWGTFNLAFHAWTEPVERLLQAGAAANVRLWVPRPGQSVEPHETGSAVARWWPELSWQTAVEAPVFSSGI